MDTKKFLFIAGGAFVVFVIIVVLLFTLSSGGKKKETEINLTFWNLNDDKETFDEIVNEFQESNPTVKIKYVKKDPKNYLSDVLSEIAAGRGPDVLAMPNDWLPKYHDNLIAMPDGKMANKKAKKSDLEVYEETFVKVVNQDNVINSKIYGVPLSLDTLILYYNSDMVNKALQEYQQTASGKIDDNTQDIFSTGPKNWDDFSKMVKIITKRTGNSITQSGATIGTDTNVNQSVDLLTLLMLQNGTKMTNDNHTNAQFHTNSTEFGNISYPGTKALEFYTSFADPKSENYTWDSSMPDSLHAFSEGKSAMMIDYKSEESAIKRINPNLNYDKIEIPQVKETEHPTNFASYLTYTVTRASKNSDLAWNFVLFLTNQENSIQYNSSGLKDSPRLSDVEKTDPSYSAENWYKPDPEKADDVFKKMIKQVNDGQNSQTAIEGAASEITTLLGRLIQ